jgi:hypothetical protein
MIQSIGITTFAQIQMTGVIYDDLTNTGIPYVNIGIRGTDVGTSSFEDGEFEILIPEKHKSDSLTFSAIGYTSFTQALSSLTINNSVIIRLKQDATLLNEVVIRPDRPSKPALFGLFGGTTMGQQFSSRTGGAAMAILLNQEGKTISIDHAVLFIHKNELPEFKLRCRIQENADGIPGRDLLNKNVVVSTTIKRGEVKFDLSSFTVIVNTSFFLVIEWVVDKAMSDYYRQNETRPSWWPEDAMIYNRNTLVFLNEEHKIIHKIKMTKEQQQEYERIRLHNTEFSVKQTKKFKTLARRSSLSPWEEVSRDVVASVLAYEH